MSAPREWVDDWSTFGQVDVRTRRWRPPVAGSKPKDLAEFRGAVVQNAYCVHLRQAKNQATRHTDEGTVQGWEQVFFASFDERPRAVQMWNDRLCGRTWLTPTDIAVIAAHLPGAIPTSDQLRVFLDAATQRRWTPPPDWEWPDRRGRQISEDERAAKREAHLQRRR